MRNKASFGDFFKKKLEYIVALVALTVMAGISLTESGRRFEYRLYDTLLSIKPEIDARSDILFVDIDNSAIEQIGAWPWSRDIFADSLIRLKEAGGGYITFDIEFLSPGQEGVNRIT
jgi:adenylate cyclase